MSKSSHPMLCTRKYRVYNLKATKITPSMTCVHITPLMMLA